MVARPTVTQSKLNPISMERINAVNFITWPSFFPSFTPPVVSLGKVDVSMAAG